jgi:alcohol dehydrogenase class IV
MAQEAIRALSQALPRFLADAGDRTAWSDALYGAWLASTCAGTVGVALHHKICHTLGGAFDLSHADVHCVMLPYTAAFNGEAAPEAMRHVAEALGAEEAPGALYDLMQVAATAKSLKQMGLTMAALGKAADLAARDPYDNPRSVTRDEIMAILAAAYEGERP